MNETERALADQLEAEARTVLERSLWPQSTEQVNHSMVEFGRQMGLPVVDATHEQVGNELRFDLKIALPRGQG